MDSTKNLLLKVRWIILRSINISVNVLYNRKLFRPTHLVRVTARLVTLPLMTACLIGREMDGIEDVVSKEASWQLSPVVILIWWNLKVVMLLCIFVRYKHEEDKRINTSCQKFSGADVWCLIVFSMLQLQCAVLLCSSHSRNCDAWFFTTATFYMIKFPNADGYVELLIYLYLTYSTNIQSVPIANL